MKKLKKIKLKSVKQKHSKKITQCNKKSQKVFLLKLFNVLNDKEKGFSKYIYWSTKGNSFIIPDKDEFAENVLPNICKTKIYTSFVRNLNLYGFRKTENKPIEYEHEEFTQSKNEEEINLIKKKNKKRKIEEEPIHTNKMLDEKIGEDNKAEDKNIMEKIEELDEESKLKEFTNTPKKGLLSDKSYEQILIYLLDKIKDIIESKKLAEENYKDVILYNHKLNEQIQLYKEQIILREQIIQKQNQIIASLKKNENKIIENEDIKNLKSNNISMDNNTIVFNDNNFLNNNNNNQDTFNNNTLFNIDIDNENNNELLNSGSSFGNKIIIKNILDRSNHYSGVIKINNNNILKNNLINFNNSLPYNA